MQLVNLLETTRNQQLDKIIVQSDKMNIVWKLGLIVVSLRFAFFLENNIQNDWDCITWDHGAIILSQLIMEPH